MSVLGAVIAGRRCLVVVAVVCCGHLANACDITIDSTQTFQTITGWGHSGGNLATTLPSLIDTLLGRRK